VNIDINPKLRSGCHRGVASGSSIAGMCEPLLITSKPSRFVLFG
jgi:hypothetical protein